MSNKKNNNSYSNENTKQTKTEVTDEVIEETTTSDEKKEEKTPDKKEENTTNPTLAKIAELENKIALSRSVVEKAELDSQIRQLKKSLSDTELSALAKESSTFNYNVGVTGAPIKFAGSVRGYISNSDSTIINI